MSDKPVKASDVQPKPGGKQMADTKEQMSKTERSELRRLLKARFKLLEAEFDQRVTDIKDDIRARIEAQHEEAAKRYEEAAAPIFEQLDATVATLKEIDRQARREGVAPGKSVLQDEYVVVKNTRGHPHYKLDDDGAPIMRKRKRSFEDTIITVSTARRFVPINLENAVQTAFAKFARETGYAGVSLEREKLQLEEKLVMSAITSDEAQGFIDELPDADKLLPVNGNRGDIVQKVIEATAVELDPGDAEVEQ